MWCDEEDVLFDDHLSDIEVPVLYVGADGGIGEFGFYTTTLFGSENVDLHNVDLMPPDKNVSDFGHADLFLAEDAQVMAWERILERLNEDGDGDE